MGTASYENMKTPFLTRATDNKDDMGVIGPLDPDGVATLHKRGALSNEQLTAMKNTIMAAPEHYKESLAFNGFVFVVDGYGGKPENILRVYKGTVLARGEGALENDPHFIPMEMLAFGRSPLPEKVQRFCHAKLDDDLQLTPEGADRLISLEASTRKRATRGVRSEEDKAKDAAIVKQLGKLELTHRLRQALTTLNDQKGLEALPEHGRDQAEAALVDALGKLPADERKKMIREMETAVRPSLFAEDRVKTMPKASFDAPVGTSPTQQPSVPNGGGSRVDEVVDEAERARVKHEIAVGLSWQLRGAIATMPPASNDPNRPTGLPERGGVPKQVVGPADQRGGRVAESQNKPLR